MKPFILTPAYKDYLWGGSILKTEYGRNTQMTPLAESWELSAHPDGESRVQGGEFSGTGLSELFLKHPQMFGRRCSGLSGFPILIKLIDAAQPLSVQVHPGDAYAEKTAGCAGKTEMWVVLECKAGAYLYLGFKTAISRREYGRRISDGTLEEALQAIPVKKGDVFFIPAGVIHAIGAGLVIAEIQQSSNLTYRVYDYGRSGPDGKPRQLHIAEALSVTCLSPASPTPPGATPPAVTPAYTVRQIAGCPYFSVRGLELRGEYIEELDGSCFVSVLCTGGSAKISGGENDTDSLPVQKGDSLFVPADLRRFTLCGSGSFLLTGI